MNFCQSFFTTGNCVELVNTEEKHDYYQMIAYDSTKWECVRIGTEKTIQDSQNFIEMHLAQRNPRRK